MATSESPTDDATGQQHRSEQDRQRDRRTYGRESGIGGAASDTAEMTGGVVTAIVDVTSGAAVEVIHAVGRVGVTLADEVFNVIGSIVGGASETVSSVFQGGRRMPRRAGREGRERGTETRAAEHDTERAGSI